jgi:hypothetical protein
MIKVWGFLKGLTGLLDPTSPWGCRIQDLVLIMELHFIFLKKMKRIIAVVSFP